MIYLLNFWLMLLLSCFGGNNQQENSKEANEESNTPHVISNKTNQYELVWSEEFNIDGAPDNSIWNYEIGNGCDKSSGCGWGIGQSQFYTNRLENARVENGVLKIIAKKETYQGSSYTSARLFSKNKYEFTYGKVEVRAKLPRGKGTWPAIWMLGATRDTEGWPTCGEIDIMEHWGHKPGIISSATHNDACYGGCGNTRVGETIIDDYDTAFHTYGLEWTEDELRFLIDDTVLYTYNPQIKTKSNWPYNKPQYFILNVALGGGWFKIDPDFTESTMEIDYIKVYQ